MIAAFHFLIRILVMAA